MIILLAGLLCFLRICEIMVGHSVRRAPMLVSPARMDFPPFLHFPFSTHGKQWSGICVAGLITTSVSINWRNGVYHYRSSANYPNGHCRSVFARDEELGRIHDSSLLSIVTGHDKELWSCYSRRFSAEQQPYMVSWKSRRISFQLLSWLLARYSLWMKNFIEGNNRWKKRREYMLAQGGACYEIISNSTAKRREN